MRESRIGDTMRKPTALLWTAVLLLTLAPSPSLADASLGRNVALASEGATATASSVGCYFGCRPPDFAINGNPQDIWAGTTYDAWLQVAFAESTTVHAVVVLVHCHTHRFVVDLSLDGSTWTRVAGPHTTKNTAPSGNCADDDRAEFRFSPVQARFLRVTNLWSDAPGSHIFKTAYYEVEAYANAAPGPVQGLAAEPGPDLGAVTLTWTAPATGTVQEYAVHRDAVPVGTTTATVFRDSGLADGATHCYEARARNAYAEGPSSGPVCVATWLRERPGPPENLTARPDLGGGVDLSWSEVRVNGAPPVREYLVHRYRLAPGCVELSGGCHEATWTTDATAFRDADVPAGIHAYHVQACNLVGCGGTRTALTPAT